MHQSIKPLSCHLSKRSPLPIENTVQELPYLVVSANPHPVHACDHEGGFVPFTQRCKRSTSNDHAPERHAGWQPVRHGLVDGIAMKTASDLWKHQSL